MSPAPLAQRTRRAIFEAIAAKRYERRLPPEDELARILDVSRFTVRVALYHLEREGIILRRRGVGTTVNPHVDPTTLALQRMIDWDDALKARGHRVRTETAWRRTKVSGAAAALCEMKEGELSLEIRREYYADGRLAIEVLNIAPWTIMRDPDFQGVVPLSLNEFAVKHWCEPIEQTGVEVWPAVVGSSSDLRLSLPSGSPYIELRERHYGKGDRLIAISEVAIDPELLPLTVVRR